MRRSLWLKLVGSFALIVLVAAAALIVSIRQITESRYARMVRDSDMARAESLAPVFARWYEQHGGWRGVRELVGSQRPEMGMMGDRGNWGRMGWGMTGDGMMGWDMRGRDARDDRDMMDMEEEGMAMAPRVVLTSPDGEVVVDSAEVLSSGTVPFKDVSQAGAKVVSRGQLVGRLLVGSLVGPSFTAADRQFLGSVNAAVLLTSATAVLLSLLAGSLIFRHVVSPLRQMAQASERIAAGDLNVRVPNRSDELGVLAGRFNTMAAALRESQRRQRQLVSDAAHELRTPVSLIQGTLEMMVEGIYPADRERLEQLYNESRRLGGLVADMQDLARSDAGRLELSVDRVHIAEIVEEAVTPFQTAVQGKGIRMQVVGAGLREEILGDRSRLVRVLVNLLANALHHTPGGGKIKISADRSPDLSNVVVSVQDSGPGIPAHEAARVFDRFYRTDGSRSRDSGGSGLGLAISREIVTAHSGRIWVDTSYKSGARVCFSIPCTGPK